MADKKKKKNYLRIEDPKLNKVFWWVASAILAIAGVTLTIIIVELISLRLSEIGQDVASLFPGLEPLVERFFVVFLILFIAFLTIVIYVYATNRENDKINKKKSPNGGGLDFWGKIHYNTDVERGWHVLCH